MHTTDLSAWRHSHVFDSGNPAGERSTRAVMWLTAAMMLVEIAAGWYFNSMALMADGFHMSSHAVAIGLSAFAYAAARRKVSDPRFAFGTWKIEILGGFASAVFLLVIVALMVYGSVERLLSPQPIQFREATLIAVVGLVVNLVSAGMLGAAHHHHDHHDHHGHGHTNDRHGEHSHGHDLNLHSAYIHVVADAATSGLAIIALLGGWFLGWNWLDPLMGLAGAVVVAVWAKGLLAQTSKVLLDREMDHPVVGEIRSAIEEPGAATETRVTDLHVWRVGRASYACAVTVVSHDPKLTAMRVREWISIHEEVVHATIEVHTCPGTAESC